MLRSNLSTRPFYNERATHVVLGVAALLVLGLTIFNIVRVVSLSRQNTELSRHIDADRSEADRLRKDADRIRRGLNQAELRAVADAAAEANALIDQRTFSWTAFFNHIEDTLPSDVMLTQVRPTFKEDQTVVSMTVLGRRAEDIEEFVEKLEATGAFMDCLPRESDPTDDGLRRTILECLYIGAEQETSAPAGAAIPAAATAEGDARQ